PRQSIALSLALVAGAARAGAQSALPDPALDRRDRPAQLEVEISPQVVDAKFHMRLGSATVAGDDLAAQDSGLLYYHPAWGMRVLATLPDPLLGDDLTVAFGYRYLYFHGRSDFAPHSFAGHTITHLETTGTFNELDFELRQHVAVASWLTLQVGAAVENRIF